MKRIEQEIRITILGPRILDYGAMVQFYDPVIDKAVLHYSSMFYDSGQFRLFARSSTSQYGQGMYDEVPDLTVLTEEELFQYSLLWSFQLPIEAACEMQKTVLKHVYQNTFAGDIIESIKY